MSDHDPLCPRRGLNHYEVHGLIARVRADERERIAQEFEALGATFEAGQPILIDRNYAARIARGGTP